MDVTRLVAPGPGAPDKTTPTLPVAKAYQEAIYPAPCSCLAVTILVAPMIPISL